MSGVEAELVFWSEVAAEEGRARHGFYLAGASGTVQFLYWTYPAGSRTAEMMGGRVQGVDVGYHSPVPRYRQHPAQTAPGERCPSLRGPLAAAPCFYDGSGLAGIRWAELMVGADGVADAEQVRERLAGYYRKVFGEPPDPDASAEPWMSPEVRLAQLRELGAKLEAQAEEMGL